MPENDLYAEVLRFGAEAEEKLRRGKKIIKARDLEFEYRHKRNNRGATLVDPRTGFEVKSICMHISEIGAGSNTKMHRHFIEAIIYIVKGKGYSIIGDEKVEWEQGDCIFIPPFFWHQHFNLDPQNTATYVAAKNGPLMEALGLLKYEDKEG